MLVVKTDKKAKKKFQKMQIFFKKWLTVVKMYDRIIVQ